MVLGKSWALHHLEVPSFCCHNNDDLNITSMGETTKPLLLPLPFWYHKVLEEIMNNLGTLKKMDHEEMEKGLFTCHNVKK